MTRPHAWTRIARRSIGITLTATVMLFATACGGGSGGGNSTATTPPANQPPIARISVSSADGVVPLTITFDGSASSDPDGTITAYQWTFGDSDRTAAGAVVTHTYTDTGSFTAWLRVTDDRGASGSASRAIRVRGATVSGTVRIAPESDIDSDVNDRFTSPTANNDFGTAQPIRNPVVLGGFVNRPGTGSETGNFRVTGDPDDFYFVSLLGTERIVLSIGDPSADLDLRLYAATDPPVLVDASISTDRTEDILAPGPGDYFIRVEAVAGASNYVLSVDEDPAVIGTGRRAKRLSDDFVIGEVLVAPSAGALTRYRLDRPREGRHARLGRFSDGDRAPPEVRVADPTLTAGAVASPELLARYRTLLAVKALQGHAEVEAAEPNVIRRILREPNDEFYSFQWHYPSIELDQAWEITTGQHTGHPEVVVAVVDTGALLEHPDLRNQWLRDAGGAVVGFDFIQDPERANDGDGIDPNPEDPGDSTDGPAASSFHGTHVAGTIAAESDNAIGVAGVSWGARLMPLRALGVGGGTTFDVMQSVRYAAQLPNVSGTVPPVRADIINLSLGSDFFSEAEQSTFNEVRARGILVVASAGNAASNVPSYPASYDGVVSVAATTRDRTRAGYSNFGPLIDVAAPGGDALDRDGDGFPDGVASTVGADDGSGGIGFAYGIKIGTSMAAPHVAGVMALMKSIYPALTPAEFDALLESGEITDDAGAPGRDDFYGHGIINARKAVEAALALQSGTGGVIGTVLSVSAGTLDFQSFTATLDFSVTNLGDQTVTVTIGVDQPWLSVSPLAVDGNGLGTYRAAVDRDGLPPGAYSAVITIEPDDADAAPRSIIVLMRVASANPVANAGQHYVLLVPVDDNVAVALDVVNAVDGEYAFRIDDVPPGEYRLFAGTDLNDDDFICDGGEACGAFPSLAEPAVLVVDPAGGILVLDDLVFASEFRTTATTGGQSLASVAGADRGIRVPASLRRSQSASQPGGP
jgi:serine protease